MLAHIKKILSSLCLSEKNYSFFNFFRDNIKKRTGNFLPSSYAPQRIHTIKFHTQNENSLKKFDFKEFESLTGVKYLSELEFENRRVLRQIREQCNRAFEGGCIDEKRQWLGALYGKDIQNRHIADVYINWVNKKIGYGLFAERDLKAWEFIGEYTGLVKERDIIFCNINDYCFSYPTSPLNFKKHTIDAQDMGNETRYANHSDFPNCESISVFYNGTIHIIIRSIKEIPAHSQITYNYKDLYWRSREKIPNF